MENELFKMVLKICQNAYLFLKKVDFCIFEPKNREVREHSSKAPYIFSSLKCTYMYLGKNHFNIISALSDRGHFLLRFSVHTIGNHCGEYEDPR